MNMKNFLPVFFSRILETLTGLLLVGNFCLFLYQASLLLSHPYSVNVVEGAMWASVAISSRFGLYPDYFHWPYIPTSYPPLFYLLTMGVHFLTNWGLAAGRLVSLIASLLTAGIFFKIVYERTKKIIPAGVIFFCFFISPDIYHWGLIYRIDLLMMLNLTAAVYWGMVRGKTFTERMLSVIFLILAFFTKSTCLITVGFLFVYWFFCELRQRKSEASFWKRIPIQTAVLSCFLILSIFLITQILQFLAHGRYVQSVFGLMSVMTKFHFRHGVLIFRDFINYVFPLIFFAILILLPKVRARALSMEFYFSFLAFMTATFSLWVIGSREGSDSNYVLEAYMWLFVLLSFGIGDVWKEQGYRKIIQGLIVLSCFAFFVEGSQHHDVFMQIGDVGFYRGDAVVKKILQHRLEQIPGEALAEDPAIAIRASKTPVFEPYILGALSQKKIWDPGPFIQEIERGDYAYVVFIDRYRDHVPFFMPLLEKYYKKVWTCKSPMNHMTSKQWVLYQWKNQVQRSDKKSIVSSPK